MGLPGWGWVKRKVAKRAAKQALKGAGVSEETVQKIMSGWKTWAAAALGVASIVMPLFPQTAPFVAQVQTLAASLGLVGVAHKIEKAGQ